MADQAMPALRAAVRELADALDGVVGALRFAARTDLARGECATTLERVAVGVRRARERLEAAS